MDELFRDMNPDVMEDGAIHVRNALYTAKNKLKPIKWLADIVLKGFSALDELTKQSGLRSSGHAWSSLPAFSL